MTTPPPIDSRDAAAILRQLQELRTADPDCRLWEITGELDDALCHVFARYCEIIISRLNRAPDNNFLAFLNMLGATPLPPRAARVPLTFSLVEKATSEVTVPARTQIAAQPQPGDPDPVVFETEEEFVLTPAQLKSLYVKNGALDQYADLQAILENPGCDDLPVFHGNANIPHVLYVGLTFPNVPFIEKLTLVVDIEPESSGRDTGTPPDTIVPQISWEIWNGKEALPLTTARDDTAGLTHGGQVQFEGFVPPPRAEINGVEAQWVRCRLLTPLVHESLPQIGYFRSITFRAETNRTGLQPDAAADLLAPLDVTTDFLPFGLRPRQGALFYLASEEAFSHENTDIRLRIELANPAAAPTVDLAPGAPAQRGLSVPPVNPVGVVLRFEIWDGSTWIPIDDTDVTDGTASFSRDGEIQIHLRKPLPHTTVAGQEKRWIRVRIIRGDYGREAIPETDSTGTLRYVPSTLAPPVLRSVTISYHLEQALAQEAVFAWNDFRYHRIYPNQSVRVFQPIDESDPALYLGFLMPASLETRFFSIYFGVRNISVAQRDSRAAPLIWEYWNGHEWTPRTVEDETANFRRSGIVRVILPADTSECGEFNKSMYWIRVRRAAGFVDVEPRLEMVLVNTAMASQTLTVVDEVLGSGTGLPGQKFRTTRAPILEGLNVEVMQNNQAGDLEWIVWQQVRTLLASSPFDRHYVVDYLAGEISFGDNVYGAVPPVGKGNIRIREYRTGGGRRGNLPPLTITELRKAIKYVDRVTNHRPALGGADAEGEASLLHTEPTRLRHRGYAVTAADYEDLAREASSAVARAYCVPLYDLVSDPARKREKAGVVSLILVPQSDSSAVQPDLELLDQVRRYLGSRRPAGVELVLLGPDYLRVSVTAQIVVSRLGIARRVERDAVRAVTQYLRTITGRGGTGWSVGAVPSRSELLTLIESLPDVSYIRSLEISREPPSTENRGNFLIYPGTIVMTAELEG